jgi:hypothetical protein
LILQKFVTFFRLPYPPPPSPSARNPQLANPNFEDSWQQLTSPTTSEPSRKPDFLQNNETKLHDNVKYFTSAFNGNFVRRLTAHIAPPPPPAADAHTTLQAYQPILQHKNYCHKYQATKQQFICFM